MGFKNCTMDATNKPGLLGCFLMCIMDECLHFSANMCVDLSWFLLNYYGKNKRMTVSGKNSTRSPEWMKE